MRSLDAIVYDAEIVKAIQGRGEELRPGVEYCGGWGDYAGMGVAVVCCIDLRDGRPRVFLADNLDEFAQLAASRGHIIGFNSQMFDDKLLAARGFPIATTYDVKVEVFAALGQSLKSYKGSRSLDRLAAANLGAGKEMSGAMAPVLWQRGEHGKVIDYCMADVFKVVQLLELPKLIDPVTGRPFTLRPIETERQPDLLVA